MFSVGGTTLGRLFRLYIHRFWSNSLHLCVNMKLSDDHHICFSDYISFILHRILVSKAAISSHCITPPCRINRSLNCSVDLRWFNKLAAGSTTTALQSYLSQFWSDFHHPGIVFKRFSSLSLVALFIWRTVRPFFCYFNFFVQVTDLACLFLVISPPFLHNPHYSCKYSREYHCYVLAMPSYIDNNVVYIDIRNIFNLLLNYGPDYLGCLLGFSKQSSDPHRLCS